MKHIIFLIIAALVIAANSSCKMLSDHAHTAQMDQMKDSIFKAYPSVAAVTINVKDNKWLYIAIGSRRLAAEAPNAHQKTAGDIARMSLRLFGNESGIAQQKLTITANEQNDAAEPTDGFVSVINLDSLGKALK